MSTYNLKIRPTVSSELLLDSVALGTAGQAWTAAAEAGKVVKLAAADNYVPVSDADDIEGIVRTVEPGTVNSGFCYGSIQTGGRALAVVGAGTVAVGAFVVAGTQAALGTANTDNKPVVKAGAGVAFKWRCVSIVTGTGAVGDTIVIERV